MKKIPILIISIGIISACGGVKLIDIPNSTSALNLSPEQQEPITTKISVIRDIVEDYEFDKDEIESHYHGYRSEARMDQLSRYQGEQRMYRQSVRARNTLRAKIREFIMQRNAYLKEIAGLLKEIKAALTPEQNRRLNELKIPDLRLPSMIKPNHYRGLDVMPGHISVWSVLNVAPVGWIDWITRISQPCR